MYFVFAVYVMKNNNLHEILQKLKQIARFKSIKYLMFCRNYNLKSIEKQINSFN